MVGPEVRQALPFPGKREARRAVARAEADVRRRRAGPGCAASSSPRCGRSTRGCTPSTRSARPSAAARELLDMLAATAATRYSVGEAEQEAVIKAQLEVSRLEERSDDLDAERAALVAALNRLLDRPGGAPLGSRSRRCLPGDVPPSPGRMPSLASSAEVAVRRAAVDGRRAPRSSVARLELKPDFTTGAAVGLRGGLDPVVTLRFGVELPFWRKEQAAADDPCGRARAGGGPGRAARRRGQRPAPRRHACTPSGSGPRSRSSATARRSSRSRAPRSTRRARRTWRAGATSSRSSRTSACGSTPGPSWPAARPTAS